RYLSNYDSLTGLPNRQLFQKHFLSETETLVENSVVGIFVIYLSRLAMISDTLGSRASDHVMREAASRLKEALGHSNTAARLGDCCLAVATAHENVDALTATADKILAALDLPYQLDVDELHAEPLVGVTVCPTDGNHFDDLVQAAEAAARQAPSGLGRRLHFYNPELKQGATERINLERALRRAIECQEFSLYYQPQINLMTGEISGLEALIRWNHPEWGLVAPTRFIPMAEETVLIV